MKVLDRLRSTFSTRICVVCNGSIPVEFRGITEDTCSQACSYRQQVDQPF